MTHLQRLIKLHIAIYIGFIENSAKKNPTIYLWDYSSSKKATVQSSFHLENMLINTGSEKTRLIV